CAGGWKSVLCFLFLPGLAFCYSIINGPTNATVLAGSEARFNCTVSEGWVILIWLSNGSPVLTVSSSQGPFETSDRFTSQNYTSSSGFTSELIIHNTQLSDSGKIECSVQGADSKFAFLSVQVNGSLSIKNSTLTVKENETIEIFCEALGWAPAPDITWMTNDSFIDKSKYVTQQSQGSNGLYDALSILTLTLTDTEILTCLADIEALPNPQNASVTCIFVNSTLGNACTVLPILRTVLFALFCFQCLRLMTETIPNHPSVRTSQVSQPSGRRVSRQTKLAALIAWQGAEVTGHRYTASCDDRVHFTVMFTLQ
uniref:Ig-like domain-containing protein n=1 Tax=Calidris pygmaea TaxID=425635 RepID=A0A8C3JZ98_9CHAR